MSSNGLWQQEKYLTGSKLILNTSIIEYDLKSANTSVAREFNLLPEDMITELEGLPKRDRVVKLGLYKKEHKEYNDKERAAFMQARKMFFDANNLTPERVVAIKKDAIFVEGIVKNTKLTKNINFRQKNEYTSYMYLGKLEIFYSSLGLDIKGMNKDAYEEYHERYFGDFIKRVFAMLEVLHRKNVLKYIRQYYDKYKWLQLEPDNYREFSPRSQYRYKDGAFYNICIDKEELDISYNAGLIIELVSLFL